MNGAKIHELKGETIFKEGEASGCAYYIESGKVGIYRSGLWGYQTKLIEVLRSGDFLGEMGLIDDLPRSATAIALEPCELTIISKYEFQFLSNCNNKFFVRLIKTLTRRLRQTMAKLKKKE